MLATPASPQFAEHMYAGARPTRHGASTSRSCTAALYWVSVKIAHAAS